MKVFEKQAMQLMKQDKVSRGLANVVHKTKTRRKKKGGKSQATQEIKLIKHIQHAPERDQPLPKGTAVATANP